MLVLWGGVQFILLLSGLVVFWYVHPHAPDIVDRIVRKPKFLALIHSEKSCERCHQRLDPGMYLQWRESVHASVNVGCASCHGKDHEAVFEAKGKVSAGVCGECHEKVVTEFGTTGHATAEKDAVNNARFLSQSESMQKEGCLGCHSIGRRFADGSVGGCNKCHPGHAFSVEVAREPEACEVCHIGPDHPQVEAYRTSVHGVLYLHDRDPAVAPTCVTCHMPAGSHGNAGNLTLGEIASGAVIEGGVDPAIPMRVITRETADRNRKEMLKVCAPCHTTRFAREQLERADAIKLEADALVGEAKAIVEALRNEGALERMPADRPSHPISGHAMVLGGQQVYENTTEIEQAFFRMYKFYHAKTFKAAYHNSPDITHWMGIVPMKMELDKIRSEARRLRFAKRVDEQLPVQTQGG